MNHQKRLPSKTTDPERPVPPRCPYPILKPKPRLPQVAAVQVTSLKSITDETNAMTIIQVQDDVKLMMKNQSEATTDSNVQTQRPAKESLDNPPPIPEKPKLKMMLPKPKRYAIYENVACFPQDKRMVKEGEMQNSSSQSVISSHKDYGTIKDTGQERKVMPVQKMNVSPVQQPNDSVIVALNVESKMAAKNFGTVGEVRQSTKNAKGDVGPGHNTAAMHINYGKKVGTESSAVNMIGGHAPHIISSKEKLPKCIEQISTNCDSAPSKCNGESARESPERWSRAGSVSDTKIKITKYSVEIKFVNKLRHSARGKKSQSVIHKQHPRKSINSPKHKTLPHTRSGSCHTMSQSKVQQSVSFAIDTNNDWFDSLTFKRFKVLIDNLLAKDRKERLNREQPCVQKISQEIEQIMLSLSEGIAECEPRLKGDIVPMGSFYNHTKLSKADEFDFIYELDKNLLCSGFTDGTVQWRNTDKTWCVYSSSSNMTWDIKTAFQTAINNVMNNLELPDNWEHGGYRRPRFGGLRQNGPAFMFQFVVQDSDPFVVHPVTVDLTGAIKIMQKVDPADIFPTDSDQYFNFLGLRTPRPIKIWKLLTRHETSFSYAENDMLKQYGDDSIPKILMRICKIIINRYAVLNSNDVRHLRSQVNHMKDIYNIMKLKLGVDGLQLNGKTYIPSTRQMRVYDLCSRSGERFCDLGEDLDSQRCFSSYMIKKIVITMMALESHHGTEWTQSDIPELMFNVFDIMHDQLLPQHRPWSSGCFHYKSNCYISSVRHLFLTVLGKKILHKKLEDMASVLMAGTGNKPSKSQFRMYPNEPQLTCSYCLVSRRRESDA